MRILNTKNFLNWVSKYDTDRKVQKIIANEHEDGKQEVAEGIFVIPLSYETKNDTECLWEAHRKYYDVHIVVSGVEHHHVTDLDKMKTSSEYNTENDYQLFEGDVQHSLELTSAHCVIYSPNDVHKTGVALNGQVEKVRKMVLKVDSELIKDVG